MVSCVSRTSGGQWDQWPLNKRSEGYVGCHLLYTGLQASKCLSGHLQPLLRSPGVSSRLSQHPLDVQRSALGPGCTAPERCR